MKADNARQRARAHILGAMRDGMRNADGRIASVRTMAAETGVSELTMWRAVRELANEGVLVTRQGSGIRMAGQPHQAEAPVPAQHPWKMACDLLERDIAAGEFRFSPAIPSVKELTARYSVAYRTLRKALQVLESRRVLSRSGRWYRIATVARRSRDTVVLIARGSRSGGLELPTPRMEQQLRVLHGECARAGVTLKAFGTRWFTETGMEFTPDGEAMMGGKGQGAILGYIVWSTSLPFAAVQALLDRLVSTRRPVSLLDENGEFADGDRAGSLPGVMVFSTSHSRQPGLLAGRFLHALGHRRVAYITLWPSVRWSVNRELGLRQALEQGGAGGTVVRISPAADTKEQVEPLVHLDRLLPRLAGGAAAHDDAFAKRLQRALSVSSEYFQAMMHWQDTQEAAEPLYADALEQGTVSAWAAANDLLALGAQKFLVSRGKKVPRDLSVIGFDDTPEAFAAELTSYNFNLPAIAHAMLHHILGSGTVARGKKTVVEIEGFISERTSTTAVSPR